MTDRAHGWVTAALYLIGVIAIICGFYSSLYTKYLVGAALVLAAGIVLAGLAVMRLFR